MKHNVDTGLAVQGNACMYIAHTAASSWWAVLHVTIQKQKNTESFELGKSLVY